MVTPRSISLLRFFIPQTLFPNSQGVFLNFPRAGCPTWPMSLLSFPPVEITCLFFLSSNTTRTTFHYKSVRGSLLLSRSLLTYEFLFRWFINALTCCLPHTFVCLIWVTFQTPPACSWLQDCKSILDLTKTAFGKAGRFSADFGWWVLRSNSKINK